MVTFVTLYFIVQRHSTGLGYDEEIYIMYVGGRTKCTEGASKYPDAHTIIN